MSTHAWSRQQKDTDSFGSGSRTKQEKRVDPLDITRPLPHRLQARAVSRDLTFEKGVNRERIPSSSATVLGYGLRVRLRTALHSFAVSRRLHWRACESLCDPRRRRVAIMRDEVRRPYS